MTGWFLIPQVSFDAVSELYVEKPRAAAVVGGAILDAVIHETLKARLPVEGRTRDGLLNPAGGRLGDVDTKTKLLYVLGVLSKPAFTDAQLIGSIRNKFAHRLEISTFDDPIIVDLCNELTLIDTVVFSLSHIGEESSVGRRYWESDLEEKRKDPKQRFIVTIRVLTEAMIEIAPDARPSRMRQLI